MKLQGSSLKKNRLILYIVRLGQLLTDLIVKSIWVKETIASEKSPKKLLIIDTGAIGDLVILTGILPYIREIYPSDKWTIDLIAGHQFHSIIKLLDLGILGISSIVDLFIPINTLSFTRNLAYRFNFQRKFVKSHYDLVICPTWQRRLSDSQLLFIISADRKVGINKDYICADLSQFDLASERSIEYVTKDIFQSPTSAEDHHLNSPWISEVEKNVMILKYLGISCKIDGIPNWSVPSILTDEGMDMIKSYGINEPFVLICPGAFDNYRIWPPNKMSIVIDYLWSEYHLPVVICGSLAEKAISDEIQLHLKVAKAICICGQTNLMELIGLIANAKICIAMDSSPSHISIAVGTPLVSIVGGGHYQRFLPYGDSERFRVATEELDCFYCDWKCKFDRYICIEDISIERVTAEIDTLLK